MMSSRFVRAVLCVVSLCLVVGCGGPTAGISGKITLDGKPFMTPQASGSISFVSTTDGSMSQSPISSNGEYEIKIGKETSTKPGTYKVTVVATEMPLPDPARPSFVPVPRVLTPERYGASATTDLTVEVKEGKNTHDFDLKSKQ